MSQSDTAPIPAESHALSALAWLLADDGRAGRLLALTGLTPDTLRAGLGDRAMLGAVLRVIEAHEPDLLACADALGVSPTTLVAARAELER